MTGIPNKPRGGRSSRLPVALLGTLVLSLGFSAPAMAQSADEFDGVLAEIDQQKDGIADEAGALATSARLRDNGDVSGSASVLEAFLIENEEAVAARIEYAVTLCKLDDLQAGRFPAATVTAAGATPEPMARIVAACGAIPTVDDLTGSAEVGQ